MRRTRPYGPLSLLAASLLPVLGALAIHSARLGAVCVGVLVVVAALVTRERRSTAIRVALGLLAALSVALSTWLYGGHDLDLAMGAALRILYITVPAAVLTAYIDPAALGDHLGQRLRLPARPVVASVAALERLESMGQQWAQIGRARRARGVGPDGGPVARSRVAAAMSLALLVATMRTSAVLALAMDARGFAGAQRRTWAEPAPWRWGDTLILLAGIAAAALPWLLRLTPAAGPLGVG
jgi:energy-coupling factor transport system permease protein